MFNFRRVSLRPTFFTPPRFRFCLNPDKCYLIRDKICMPVWKTQIPSRIRIFSSSWVSAKLHLLIRDKMSTTSGVSILPITGVGGGVPASVSPSICHVQNECQPLAKNNPTQHNTSSWPWNTTYTSSSTDQHIYIIQHWSTQHIGITNLHAVSWEQRILWKSAASDRRPGKYD